MKNGTNSYRQLLLALGLAALSPLLFAFLCHPLIPSLPPGGGPTPAALFAPTVSAAVPNPTPGAASDIVIHLSFPAGSTLAAGAQFQVPAGWTVANDAGVVDGSLAGSIAGYMTVADQFFATDCTTAVSFDPGTGTQIDLMEATTATGTTVPGYDTDGDGKPEAVEDNNGDGLADGVTAYPAFLTSLLPGTHKARYFGHVEAAGLSELFVTILVDEVSPGGPYQVTTIVNDPTSPPESATGQFCAPQSLTLTLLGTSADNPATGTLEGGQNLYTNPATSGSYTFNAVLVSEFDNDNDGTSNGLDNCPASANADQADGDGDYLGDVCDPAVATPEFDADTDGIENGYDNCIFAANSGTPAPGITPGPDNQADSDFDDIGDACDSNPSVPDGSYYYLNCSDPVGIGLADPGGASCTAGAPTPGPTATPSGPTPTPGGKLPFPGDTDGDGCADVNENLPKAQVDNGGGRDWLNPWDYYDVNGDGFIDLLNDILGVIQHYQPAAGGDPPYDIVFDRGPTTGPNAWNMTAPDGVIDLLNDILGVIQQYQPSGCT